MGKNLIFIYFFPQAKLYFTSLSGSTEQCYGSPLLRDLGCFLSYGNNWKRQKKLHKSMLGKILKYVLLKG